MNQFFVITDDKTRVTNKLTGSPFSPGKPSLPATPWTENDGISCLVGA